MGADTPKVYRVKTLSGSLAFREMRRSFDCVSIEDGEVTFTVTPSSSDKYRYRCECEESKCPDIDDVISADTKRYNDIDDLMRFRMPGEPEAKTPLDLVVVREAQRLAEKHKDFLASRSRWQRKGVDKAPKILRQEVGEKTKGDMFFDAQSGAWIFVSKDNPLKVLFPDELPEADIVFEIPNK